MEKTKTDLLFEIDYAIRLCQLHRRLYDKIRGVLLFALLFGTGSAFSGVIKQSPELGVIAGLILSAVAVLDRVLDPAGKAAAFTEDCKRYTRLMRVARNMDAMAIQSELDSLHLDDAQEIETLRHVAYNDTLHQTGRDPSYCLQLNRWQSVLAAIA